MGNFMSVLSIKLNYFYLKKYLKIIKVEILNILLNKVEKNVFIFKAIYLYFFISIFTD